MYVEVRISGDGAQQQEEDGAKQQGLDHKPRTLPRPWQGAVRINYLDSLGIFTGSSSLI